jgi:hypothetical protein
VFSSRWRSVDRITFVIDPMRPPIDLLLTPAGGYLTPRDALMLGFLGQRYLHQTDIERDYQEKARPDLGSRVVRFSLNEAAAAMGYQGSGSWQRDLVRDSVGRLTAATITWSRVYQQGDAVVEHFTWHLVDASGTTVSCHGGVGSVRLSEETVELLKDGLMKHLKAPACRALVKADDVAARVWLFLESERMRDGFTYPLIRAESQTHSRQAFIAEVAGIGHWESHRKIKHRITRAIQVIEAKDDGRYDLRLYKGHDGWMLRAKRTARKSLSGSTSVV